MLRSYSRTLKLTPFIFEDFCSAMASPENSCILSEIHIALLKACLRADDEDQVHFAANDTNNAVNITFFALDSMTYGEVGLSRSFLQSDCFGEQTGSYRVRKREQKRVRMWAAV